MPFAIRWGPDGPHRNAAPDTLPIFPTAAIAPVIDFDQTRYTADNLTLQTESINVRNSATGASINVGVAQNELTVNGSVPPLP